MLGIKPLHAAHRIQFWLGGGSLTDGTLEVVGVGKASVMSTSNVLSRLPILAEAVRCSGRASREFFSRRAIGTGKVIKGPLDFIY